MAMDFPASPTVGQTFSSGSRTWVWTGTTWDSPTAGSNGVVGSAGGTFTGNIYGPNLPQSPNAIINGAFDIWARGTSVTPTSGYGYGADRWRTYSYSTSTSTISQQTFTPGAAPIAGLEGQFFARFNSTNNQLVVSTILEDVRTFAGQTVTFSFYAKSASAQSVTPSFAQFFGSGGSTVVVTNATTQSITTSWSRYSMTLTLPSISGKTVGANSYLEISWNGAINNAFDLWGVQLEAGAVATPFRRNAPSIQAELAACQRYYQRFVAETAYGHFASGIPNSSTNMTILLPLKVTMRTTPTSLDYGGNLAVNDTAILNTISSAALGGDGNSNLARIQVVSTGMTTYRMTNVLANNSATAYLGVSAEL